MPLKKTPQVGFIPPYGSLSFAYIKPSCQSLPNVIRIPTIRRSGWGSPRLRRDRVVSRHAVTILRTTISRLRGGGIKRVNLIRLIAIRIRFSRSGQGLQLSRRKDRCRTNVDGIIRIPSKDLLFTGRQ